MMSELSVDRLRTMLGRETNRAEAAERQMRGMSAEMTALRARIAELQSTAKAPSPHLLAALERIGGPLRVDGFNHIEAGKEDFTSMIVRDDEPGCSSILAQQMSDQMAEDFMSVIAALATPATSA